MSTANGTPSQKIMLSDLSLTLFKKNFDGSPPNSEIFPQSLTEIIGKTSNFLNTPFSKTLREEQSINKCIMKIPFY